MWSWVCSAARRSENDLTQVEVLIVDDVVTAVTAPYGPDALIFGGRRAHSHLRELERATR